MTFSRAVLSRHRSAFRRWFSSYCLQVFTGDVRGAGTRAKVFAQLFGENGETETLVLDPVHSLTKFKEFVRASQCDFSLEMSNIGSIHRVLIGQDESGVGSGWFLDKLVVVDPTSKRFEFPYGAWLGVSDGGGISGPPVVTLSAQSIVQPEVDTAPSHALKIRFGAACYPHPDKVRKGIRGRSSPLEGFGGEDAYFILPKPSTIGVADGVHVWAHEGIDAGEYSRQLMKECRDAILAQPVGKMDLLAVIQIAFQRMKDLGVKGSCTLCLLVLEGHRLLTANIGDSGFLLARPTENSIKILYRNRQQEKKFGMPFQLGHHKGTNVPEDADITAHKVRKGDIVIVGTDGLFDNVDDQQIANHILKHLQEFPTKGVEKDIKKKMRVPPPRANPNELAHSLASLAHNYMFDSSASTPFSRTAAEEMNRVFQGGKKDDITVIAGILEPIE